MQRDDIKPNGTEKPRETIGLTHLALSVGSKSVVDELTRRLQADGYTVVGQPRTTGDGYYESVVLDPDGNRHLSPHRQSSFLALNSLCVCLFLGWRKKE
jgi:lactoylglutathione lyase